MTSRILPPEEWDRLAGTELAAIVAAARRQRHRLVVLVVEDDAGTIIGCWSLFQTWHAEGLWVAPSHRGKASVGRRLLAMLYKCGRALDVPGVYTAAQTPDVERMLDRCATLLPGVHYMMPLHEEDTCLRPLQYH